MPLFKYFKRTEGHRETPSLTTNDIKKANESIAKVLEIKVRDGTWQHAWKTLALPFFTTTA